MVGGHREKSAKICLQSDMDSGIIRQVGLRSGFCFGAMVHRLGHVSFKDVRRVRLPLALPKKPVDLRLNRRAFPS